MIPQIMIRFFSMLVLNRTSQIWFYSCTGIICEIFEKNKATVLSQLVMMIEYFLKKILAIKYIILSDIFIII